MAHAYASVARFGFVILRCAAALESLQVLRAAITVVRRDSVAVPMSGRRHRRSDPRQGPVLNRSDDVLFENGLLLAAFMRCSRSSLPSRLVVLARLHQRAGCFCLYSNRDKSRPTK